MAKTCWKSLRVMILIIYVKVKIIGGDSSKQKFYQNLYLTNCIRISGTLMCIVLNLLYMYFKYAEVPWLKF